MIKLPALKIYILMVVLVLMGSSVACRLGRIGEILEIGVHVAQQENCSEIFRYEYEMFAKDLGETPETPKNSETAIYEACFIEDEVVSVRMIEMNPEKMIIPVGTYIYEEYVNDQPPPGGEDWEYELESDFTIRVADDGTVTGFKIYLLWVDYVSATGCATRNEQGITTNVSGLLDGNQGYVKLENKRWDFHEYHGAECGDGKDILKDEEDICDAIITVSGNQMDISCQGQVIYTLIKE